MNTRIIAAVLLLILAPPAFAQSSPLIQQQLRSTLKTLSAELAHADQVVVQVRNTAKQRPAQAQAQLTK